MESGNTSARSCWAAKVAAAGETCEYTEETGRRAKGAGTASRWDNWRRSVPVVVDCGGGGGAVVAVVVVV